MVFAALLVVSMPCQCLSAATWVLEDLDVALPSGSFPAGQPALAFAPARVTDPGGLTVRSSPRPGPQIFGVTHDSCLFFKPGPYVIGLVPSVTTNSVALGANAFVAPLIKGRHRDSEEQRNVLGVRIRSLSGSSAVADTYYSHGNTLLGPTLL